MARAAKNRRQCAMRAKCTFVPPAVFTVCLVGTSATQTSHLNKEKVSCRCLSGVVAVAQVVIEMCPFRVFPICLLFQFVVLRRFLIASFVCLFVCLCVCVCVCVCLGQVKELLLDLNVELNPQE